jgi:hypothetical protein
MSSEKTPNAGRDLEPSKASVLDKEENDLQLKTETSAEDQTESSVDSENEDEDTVGYSLIPQTDPLETMACTKDEQELHGKKSPFPVALAKNDKESSDHSSESVQLDKGNGILFMLFVRAILSLTPLSPSPSLSPLSPLPSLFPFSISLFLHDPAQFPPIIIVICRKIRSYNENNGYI